MIVDGDLPYLGCSDYNLALEKYYMPEYYYKYDYKLKNGSIIKAYCFSNEYLKIIFDQYQAEFVLTVGSSGDQLLYALFCGAKLVTVIDANLFTKYWINYKIAAIKNLDYKTFLVNFIFYKENCFDRKIYSKIFHSLDKDNQIFWGNIFLNEDNSKEIYRKILGRPDILSCSTYSDFFLSEKEYLKLQRILNSNNYKIEFITAEFSNFPKLVTKKYGMILLSNIFYYIAQSEERKQNIPKQYTKIVNELYKNNLQNGGIIQLHYLFGKINSQINSSTLANCFSNSFPEGKIKRIYTPDMNNATFILQKPNENFNEK